MYQTHFFLSHCREIEVNKVNSKQGIHRIHTKNDFCAKNSTDLNSMEVLMLLLYARAHTDKVFLSEDIMKL